MKPSEFTAIEIAKKNERNRCVSIIEAARSGDIDRDWRTIINMIQHGIEVEYDFETSTYKVVEDDI